MTISRPSLSPGQRRLQRASARTSHPGWWTTAAAAVAWLILVGLSVADALAPAPAMAHHAGHHSVNHATGSASMASWLLHWALMVIAMMWPLYGSSAAAITAASFRRWRVITVGTFVGVITILWLVFGLVARAAYLSQAWVPGWIWSLAWLVLAIAGTRSSWRARLLRSCGSVRVLAPAGRRAVVSALDTAVRSWPRCAALCGPVMVAMAATHQLPLMIGGSAAVWWEQRHPHAWRDPVPVVILLATATLVVVTYVGKDML